MSKDLTDRYRSFSEWLKSDSRTRDAYLDKYKDEFDKNYVVEIPPKPKLK